MTSTVVVQEIVKRYGRVEALRGVSFTLASGELVALVGHNGAGKTTLMKLMLGLIRPTAGGVTVLGEDPAARAVTARRALGYLPETVGFAGALTGQETLAFYARLKGEPAAAASKLLERVGLGDAATRRVATYSRGMRQRLGLAQALLGAPRLLLLDEPTTGLDPEFRLTFYELMRDLRDGGTTLLMSSHALSELEERADRVIIMNRGLVAAAGTMAELRSLARLPSRIVVRMQDGVSPDRAAGLAPASTVHRTNGHVAEFVCTDDDKMTVIRRVAAADAGVADIDIVPPGIDELYAHFLRGAEDRP